jgi:hypothetical protein
MGTSDALGHHYTLVHDISRKLTLVTKKKAEILWSINKEEKVSLCEIPNSIYAV